MDEIRLTRGEELRRPHRQRLYEGGLQHFEAELWSMSRLPGLL